MGDYQQKPEGISSRGRVLPSGRIVFDIHNAISLSEVSSPSSRTSRDGCSRQVASTRIFSTDSLQQGSLTYKRDNKARSRTHRFTRGAISYEVMVELRKRVALRQIWWAVRTCQMSGKWQYTSRWYRCTVALALAILDSLTSYCKHGWGGSSTLFGVV